MKVAPGDISQSSVAALMAPTVMVSADSAPAIIMMAPAAAAHVTAVAVSMSAPDLNHRVVLRGKRRNPHPSGRDAVIASSSAQPGPPLPKPRVPAALQQRLRTKPAWTHAVNLPNAIFRPGRFLARKEA